MILFITILITTVLMEGVAWGMHKYVMHGLFWNLHEDHHVRDNHDSFLERNDSFFVFFAIISITAFSLWSIFGWQISLGIGIGVLIYGVIYFVIHDLFIHHACLVTELCRGINNKSSIGNDFLAFFQSINNVIA